MGAGGVDEAPRERGPCAPSSWRGFVTKLASGRPELKAVTPSGLQRGGLQSIEANCGAWPRSVKVDFAGGGRSGIVAVVAMGLPCWLLVPRRKYCLELDR